VPVFPQTLFSFVLSYFGSFSFLSAWHEVSPGFSKIKLAVSKAAQGDCKQISKIQNVSNKSIHKVNFDICSGKQTQYQSQNFYVSGIPILKNVNMGQTLFNNYELFSSYTHKVV
jgi:hypothetical protein